jgi:hypothetical protein
VAGSHRTDGVAGEYNSTEKEAILENSHPPSRELLYLKMSVN